MSDRRKRKSPRKKTSRKPAAKKAATRQEPTPDELMSLVRKSVNAVAELDKTLKRVFELTAAQAVLRIK